MTQDKKDIRELQNKFRLLAKWKINYVKQSKYFVKYSGSATILPSKKKATIYAWRDAPDDYILHEIVHCAIRELLTRMNGKKIAGKIREAEEILVQDLCSIWLASHRLLQENQNKSLDFLNNKKEDIYTESDGTKLEKEGKDVTVTKKDS